MITDPSDPRYKDIEKIDCFSYPITAATITTAAAKDLYKEYVAVVNEIMNYESKKPDGVR